MVTTTLVREVVLETQITGDPDIYGLKDLGEKAADQLGYTHLREKITGDEESAERNRMIRALIELDASPFTVESVAGYKKKKLREDTPCLRRWFGDTPTKVVARICNSLFVLTGLTTLIVSLTALLSHYDNIDIWRFSSLMGSIFVVLLIPSVALFDQIIQSQTPAHWKRVPLRNYNQPMPEFVLTTAIEVKDRYPDCEFFVEEFIAEVWKDPFLIFSLGDQEYYLHVWNEAGFKGQREV